MRSRSLVFALSFALCVACFCTHTFAAALPWRLGPPVGMAVDEERNSVTFFVEYEDEGGSGALAIKAPIGSATVDLLHDALDAREALVEAESVTPDMRLRAIVRHGGPGEAVWVERWRGTL